MIGIIEREDWKEFLLGLKQYIGLLRLDIEMLPYLLIAIAIAILGLQLFWSRYLFSRLGDKAKFNSKKPVNVLTVISVILIYPVLEETVFRLPIYLAFFRYSYRSWIWLIIVVLSIAWTILHIPGIYKSYNNLSTISWINLLGNSLLGGILLGWLVIKTGSLAPSIICHSANNLFFIVRVTIEQKRIKSEGVKK